MTQRDGEIQAAKGVHNKPMVPTAPTSLNRYSLPSRRRHIGQPLGGGEERQMRKNELIHLAPQVLEISR